MLYISKSAMKFVPAVNQLKIGTLANVAVLVDTQMVDGARRAILLGVNKK